MFQKVVASIPKYREIAFETVTSYIDRLLFFFVPVVKWKLKQREPKKIVFVTQDPRFGLERQARALKQKYDLHIELVSPSSNLFKYYSDVFDNLVVYRNQWHFRKLICQKINNFDVIHYFARRSEMGQILIEEFNVPLIYDVKDMSITYHGINPPFWYLKKDLIFEKYCLENSKTVIAESLECCYATKEYNIKVKNNRIYFPEYCEQDKLKENNKNINQEIRIVYAGGLMGKQANSKVYGAMQFHWLIKTFEQQKIHFHVYPNPRMDRVIYREYFELSKKNNYFHMEESVTPNQLSVEMEKYHFGILPFFNEDTIRSNAKREHAASLKLFNFIEANIPILISKDMRYQSWLANRYSAGIRVTKDEIKNLRAVLSDIDYPLLNREMREKRKKIVLENNIDRLYKIYQEN